MTRLKRRVRQLVKLFRLLITVETRKALLHGIPCAIEHDHLRWMKVRTVLDVGANRGQFALQSLLMFPDAIVHSFEPLEDFRYAHNYLRRQFGERFHLYSYALSDPDSSTTASLHLSARSAASSLLPITNKMTEFAPGTEEVGTRIVQQRRLDSVNLDLCGPNLLKIDVQGAELAVLEGGGETLNGMDFVYVECSSSELYSGQALVGDVVRHLLSKGFLLQGCYNAEYSSEGICIQADYLFAKEGSATC